MAKLLNLSDDLERYRKNLGLLFDRNYLDFDLNILALKENDDSVYAAISWINEY